MMPVSGPVLILQFMALDRPGVKEGWRAKFPIDEARQCLSLTNVSFRAAHEARLCERSKRVAPYATSEPLTPLAKPRFRARLGNSPLPNLHTHRATGLRPLTPIPAIADNRRITQHSEIPMADKRETPGLADIIATVISPILIMVMVGSLIYFLIEVLYGGAFAGQLRWTFGFFVLGAVLIARIAIQM